MLRVEVLCSKGKVNHKQTGNPEINNIKTDIKMKRNNFCKEEYYISHRIHPLKHNALRALTSSMYFFKHQLILKSRCKN